MDVLLLAVTVGFFILSAWLVKILDRLS